MKFTATINDKSPRAAEWQKVFETREIEVHGLIPEKVNVLGEIRDVYMLNLQALNEDQYRRLMFHISEKFKVPIETVAQELPEVGVPVLAEDLIISCDTPFFL